VIHAWRTRLSWQSVGALCLLVVRVRSMLAAP